MTALWQVKLGSACRPAENHPIFVSFWLVSFDGWGLGLVSWTGELWGCFIIPPGARDAAGHASGWRRGWAGLPQCASNNWERYPCFLTAGPSWREGLSSGLVLTTSTCEGVQMFVKICWWIFALLVLQVCSVFLLCLNVADLQRTKDHLSTFLPIISANLASIWSFVFA